MAAKIRELESIDPGHPELSKLHLQLLVAGEEWTAAIESLSEMPSSYSKSAFLLQAAREIAHGNADDYPVNYTKAVTVPYSEYITEKGKAIGPNHFAYQSTERQPSPLSLQQMPLVRSGAPTALLSTMSSMSSEIGRRHYLRTRNKWLGLSGSGAGPV